jgi:hypothetical protein
MLSYNDALDTLQSMFSDWDRENLAQVLKLNHGHMEQTIEAILRSPVPNTKIPSGPTEIDSGYPSQPKLRGRLVRLPDDFLQVPGPEDHHMVADEQLAAMLQDELFLQELMADPDLQSLGSEFMATSPSNLRTTQNPNPLNENHATRETTEETPEESHQKWTIQSKMNELGTGMRKRLNDFAIKFKERNKTQSGHSRLVNEEENNRNEDEDDDTEVISFEGPTIKQTTQKKNKQNEEIEIPEIPKDHKHHSNKELLDTDPKNKKFL